VALRQRALAELPNPCQCGAPSGSSSGWLCHPVERVDRCELCSYPPPPWVKSAPGPAGCAGEGEVAALHHRCPTVARPSIGPATKMTTWMHMACVIPAGAVPCGPSGGSRGAVLGNGVIWRPCGRSANRALIGDRAHCHPPKIPDPCEIAASEVSVATRHPGPAVVALLPPSSTNYSGAGPQRAPARASSASSENPTATRGAEQPAVNLANCSKTATA